MHFRLDPAHSPAAELVRVVRERVQAAGQQAGDRTIPADERVHKARTFCKKIRAVLKLVRAGDPAFYARENAWFREAAHRLSSVRDADVMLEALEKLGREAGPKFGRQPQAAVRRALQSHRRDVLSAAPGIECRLAGFADQMAAAATRLAGWKLTGEDLAVFGAGLHQGYRRARRAYFTAYAKPTTRAFHKWRIAAKTHGYHLRLLRAAWPDVMKKWQAGLSELSDLLGEDHDLITLRDWISTREELRRRREPVRSLTAAIESRREALHAAADPLGRRLFAEKPRAFLRRISQWWLTARTRSGAHQAGVKARAA